MYRGSDYVVGAGLTLIIPQDIQLDIQMPQEHKGQRQTHPSDIFMAKQKYKGFMA